jgi:hypothetical protein
MRRSSVLGNGHPPGNLPWLLVPDSPKQPLRFGDLVTAVYDACGRRKASEFLRTAVNTQLVVFPRRGRYRIA